MNTRDMADLYADLSATVAALTSALRAKGLLTQAEIQQSAQARLDGLNGEPHPYLILRELAGLNPE
jgi:hypothetical protein